MCEFEFCLVEELCADLLAMRMRDYLGRLEDWKIGSLDGRLEDWTEDAGCGTTTKVLFLFINLWWCCVLVIKLGVVENVEIIES